MTDLMTNLVCAIHIQVVYYLTPTESSRLLCINRLFMKKRLHRLHWIKLVCRKMLISETDTWESTGLNDFTKLEMLSILAETFERRTLMIRECGYRRIYRNDCAVRLYKGYSFYKCIHHSRTYVILFLAMMHSHPYIYIEKKLRCTSQLHTSHLCRLIKKHQYANALTDFLL